MNSKTTLVLVALLAALVAILWFVDGDAEKTARESQRMIAGYEAAKVTRLRVENVERNEKLVLARDGAEWVLEEPVRAPADATQARFLAEYFETYEGRLLGNVGDARADAETLELALPRATLTIEGVGEAPIVVKIGGDDLQQSNDLFLQVGTQVFRAPRTIYNTLAKSSKEFRDHRLFTIPSWEVTTVELAGTGTSTVLTKSGADWRITAPFSGRADAARVGKLLSGFGSARVLDFADDSPKDLGAYGLSEPALRVTLRAGEKSQTVHVGRDKTDRTYALREGLGAVWTVALSELEEVRRPALEFRDATIVGGFTHDSVERLSFTGAHGEIALQRDATTRKIRLLRPRDAETDRDAIEEVWKSLDDRRADALLQVQDVDVAALELSPPSRWLELSLKGASASTRIGLGATVDGNLHLRREGDDYVLRVAASALPFLGKRPEEFVSKDLVSIDSFVAGHVEIDARRDDAAQTLLFEKDSSNVWKAKGGAAEHTGFRDLSESLWHAKATEVLPTDPGETPLATPSIEVRVYRRHGADLDAEAKERERVATLRFAPDGEAGWLGQGITGSATSGGFAMRVDAKTPASILALAFPPAVPESAPATDPKDGEKDGSTEPVKDGEK